MFLENRKNGFTSKWKSELEQNAVHVFIICYNSIVFQFRAVQDSLFDFFLIIFEVNSIYLSHNCLTRSCLFAAHICVFSLPCRVGIILIFFFSKSRWIRFLYPNMFRDNLLHNSSCFINVNLSDRYLSVFPSRGFKLNFG